MTSATIVSTIQAWTLDPEKARSHPTVKARDEGGMVALEAGSFSWHADLPASLGGTNQAPSPTAYLLGALAGCAVAFVKDTLAPTLGVTVTSVEAQASGDSDARGLLGFAGAAPDLAAITLSVQIETPDGDSARRRLLDVWQERCPIYLALMKPMNVTILDGSTPAQG